MKGVVAYKREMETVVDVSVPSRGIDRESATQGVRAADTGAFQSPRGESIVKGCRLKPAPGNCPWAEIDASHFCRAKTVSLFQDLKILASEMPTESGIDAIQRSHAVFKVRVDRVDDASTPPLCRT